MPRDLEQIKAILDERIGKEIVVTVQLGRRKQKERHGILRNTFRSIFIVDLDQDQHDFERVSYSYSDLLTESIEVDFPGEEKLDWKALVADLDEDDLAVEPTD